MSAHTPDRDSGPARRPYAMLRAWCDKPRADRVVVAVSLACIALCLDTGLSADDWLHSLVARGSTELHGFAHPAWDLFRFAGGEDTRALQDEGVLAWWDDRDARLAFLRPVSALTHWLDWTLWPNAPWLMHLHSMAWGALVLLCVAAVLRRLFDSHWACVLALALYALEDGRSWFGAWVAARNGVVATAISIGVLFLHHLQRAEGKRWAAWGAPVVLLVALLAGEGAIAIVAYLFAYALFLDRGAPGARARSLLPYALVLVAWRLVYGAMDYGARNSGLYFDPLGEPANFARAALERIPILFSSDVFGPWSDVYTTLFPFPRLMHALWLLSVVALGALTWALLPLLRRDPLARFGFTGASLAIVPATAPFLSDRLLTWVGLGTAIVLARTIQSYHEAPESLLGTAARRLLVPPLVAWLAISNLLVDPFMLPSRSRGNVTIRGVLDRAERSVPEDDALRDQWLVLVNPPAVPLAAYVPIQRAATGVPRARRQTWLATSATELTVERVDERTLALRQHGGYLRDPGSLLLRDPRRPVADTVVLDSVEFRTTERTRDGRPLRVLVRFDRALDDPSLRWLAWRDTGFVPFAPPAPGTPVTLPAADYLRAWFGDAIRFPFRATLDVREPDAP
jgi:hypothetical protein